MLTLYSCSIHFVCTIILQAVGSNWKYSSLSAIVIFLDFHSTKQGQPLADSWWRGLDSNLECIPIMIHWAMYPTRNTLQHVIRAWWKVGWQKAGKTVPVFFFVNEHHNIHNNTNMKPQAKKHRFSTLSQKRNSS